VLKVKSRGFSSKKFPLKLEYALVAKQNNDVDQIIDQEIDQMNLSSNKQDPNKETEIPDNTSEHSHSSDPNNSNSTLFLKNIAFTTTVQSLSELFKKTDPQLKSLRLVPNTQDSTLNLG